jgi:hypothetical protein
MDYKLKPFSGKPPRLFIDLDKKHRLKVEKALGKLLSDCEWAKYKQMVMPKSEK